MNVLYHDFCVHQTRDDYVQKKYDDDDGCVQKNYGDDDGDDNDLYFNIIVMNIIHFFFKL